MLRQIQQLDQQVFTLEYSHPVGLSHRARWAEPRRASVASSSSPFGRSRPCR